MQKLNINIAKKIISEKCTSSEIDLLLYFVRYQNTLGRIEYVKCQDVIDELSISKQTFYTSLWSLEDKGLIFLDNNINTSYSYFNINILDNSYVKAEKEGFKNKPYLSTNRYKFLYTKAFRKLSGAIKRLILGLLINLGQYKHKELSFSTFKRYARVNTNRSIYKFLKVIEPWFLIHKTGRKNVYSVQFNDDESYLYGEDYIKYDSANEKEKSIWFKLKSFLTRHHISYNDYQIADTISLFTNNKYDEKYGFLFYKIIVDTCFKHRMLKPRLINKTLNIKLKKYNKMI